tara:strand:+ start:1444 stop:1728 length:285 start_codon:yes stop_codon:yes gene_type:complete
MNQSISYIQTAKADSYLRQLCKHFGHKVPVEFVAQKGFISLPFGTCDLLAQAGALTLTVSGDDIEKLEQVIGSHLERFAFRESLDVTWERTSKS